MLRCLACLCLSVLGVAIAVACSGDGPAATSSSAVTAGVGGGAAGGAGATTTSSTGGGPPSFVGRSCEKDGHCGPGVLMKCVKSSHDEERLGIEIDVVGGPPGGYCTRVCEFHADCPSDSFCRYDAELTGGVCVLGCTFGEPVAMTPQDPTPEDKCRGRDELACVPMQDGFKLCLPVCGSDSECGDGRACDKRGGVCVDVPTTGAALSAKCTPGDRDACAGFCLAFADGGQTVTHACSSRCSFGGALAETTNCGGPSEGICAFAPSIDGEQAELGDMAYCTGACEQHDGCDYESGMFCMDVGVHAEYGKGYCLFSDSCPNGDECEDGEICKQTAVGPYCLDPDPADPNGLALLLPLGAAAPP
jgi:hypothetical protein